ncbi:MAG: phosphoglycerate kinase, partial [Leptospiraceae bacterium]|nr:phosphoglycerate kinase [Leptospiraceae bacterium]
MSLPRIDTAQVKGQRILMRVDLASAESPFCDYYLSEIATATEMLLDRGATVVIAGHAGNPEARGALPSISDLAALLSAKLDGEEVKFLASPVEDLAALPNTTRIALMENLATLDGEIKGDKDFARKLAEHCDAYVNNAFVSSRLPYASIQQLPRLLESFAGPALFQKWDLLSQFAGGKQRPAGLILGGLNVAAKIELFKKLMTVLEAFAAGGVVAN